MTQNIIIFFNRLHGSRNWRFHTQIRKCNCPLVIVHRAQYRVIYKYYNILSRVITHSINIIIFRYPNLKLKAQKEKANRFSVHLSNRRFSMSYAVLTFHLPHIPSLRAFSIPFFEARSGI